MGVTVLTESRRQTCGSSEAQRIWCAGRSRTAVTRVERRETRTEYATCERVWWFGPQNSSEGSEEERTARGGIREFASRRNYR
uniref:Uncharacterized protein n=1 Tax=Saccharum spontaneum TaxID=62335 RepID=A0A678T8X8_SACSP|nr:hypothetical protein SS31J13_000013 [Saccharum spontaneum]